MQDEKNAAPEKETALKRIRLQFTGTSRTTQRDRLKTAFQECHKLSTVEIRRHLDIIHPGGRVRDLRKEGLNIVTLWTTERSDDGDDHRVADYLLVREVAHAGGATAATDPFLAAAPPGHGAGAGRPFDGRSDGLLEAFGMHGEGGST